MRMSVATGVVWIGLNIRLRGQLLRAEGSFSVLFKQFTLGNLCFTEINLRICLTYLSTTTTTLLSVFKLLCSCT